MTKGNFAGVIINRLAFSIDRIFHYVIPAELLETVQIGSHVSVPFGNGSRLVDGFVLSLTCEIDFDGPTKEIAALLDPEPLFDQELLDVCAFLKRKYFCSYISAIKTILPPGSTRKNKVSDKMIRGSVLALPYDEAFDILEQLRDKAPRQAAVLELVLQNEFVADNDIAWITGASYGAIKALRNKGVIRSETVEVLRLPIHYDEIKPSASPVLTQEQKAAVDMISASAVTRENKTFLLHGITGSGKTEVFLNCIEKVLAKGQTAIVLVPEISLTPQMVTRFASRFGKSIAVLHSALSLGERNDEYKRIKQGEAKVVIGARSAIFAPLKNIGIIVVDEEHETSYKAENAPTYHAREVAAFRAATHGAVLVLASATPSVESFYLAQQGTYQLVSLTHRPNAQKLPEVSIVDMRKEMQDGNRSCFSMPLQRQLRKSKDANAQSILFLNRRGFSSFVSCRSCGFVIKCKNCDVSLTYHKTRGSLSCHYCGYTVRKPDICPACGGNYIKEFGTGTQKVEEELKTLFPDFSVIRMDVDTTNAKASHQSLLARFDQEKTDVLLGTQMVAKGLDFPGVTLVGVLAADQSLCVDDFRANERTFNLITQVCGRAGRGEKEGCAIIQTYMPENDVIAFAKKQDYLSFYKNEIEIRRQLHYPPFCDIVSVLFTATEQEKLFAYAKKLAQSIRIVLEKEYKEPFTMLGPCETAVSRIGGRYRQRIWIKCRLNDTAENIFARLRDYHIKSKDAANVNMVIERNPYGTI